MNVQTTVRRDDETGDIIVGEEQIPVDPPETKHSENLAAAMDDSDLDKIGADLLGKVDTDRTSRTEWEDINERAYKLLGIGPESDPDTSDYESANTSDHPLLLAAVTRFQSTAISEMLPPEKVCTGVAAGSFDGITDPAQREQAERETERAIDRVEQFYLDYLTDRLPCYIEDTDLILRDCAMTGVGIRKVYVDPTLSAPVRADYVPIQDLIISYSASSMRDGRITHSMRVSPSAMLRLMQRSVYRVVDLNTGAPDPDKITDAQDFIQGLKSRNLTGDDGYNLLETHCRLFLPNDPHEKGLSRPYVVTTHKETGKVLAVRRNWVEGDPDERPIETFVAYTYHPGKSAIFALGLGALMSNQTEALRDGQRAALTAGYLANHPAGFKKSSLSIREDNTRVAPGEFVDVDSPGGGPISDALMVHPFRGPDAGLMQLIQHMEQNGKELGGVATADLSGMMGASVAPGPALAAFDEQTKFQNAVHARIYRANRRELNLVHARMREIYANRPVPYGKDQALQPTDLIMVDIRPAMDPSQVTRSRRLIEAQMKMDLATQFPEVINKRAAVIDFLAAAGTTDVDHLIIPDQEQAQPADAVTEYGNALKGMPLAVGPAQNHQAHIETHIANMRGIEKSELPVEQGQQVSAVLAAHIAEHMAMDVAVQVASGIGMTMEEFAQGIPPEIEAQVAPMIAQAVVAIEEMRAGEDPEATKVRIAEINAENKIAIEHIKGQYALQREDMESEQNQVTADQRERANREDNATAMLIAGMRGGPGTGVPSTNPSPSPGNNSNDQNPNPSPRKR